MNAKEIKTILDNVPREELVEKICGWIKDHRDFQDYILGSYMAKTNDKEDAEVNFGKMMHNAMSMYQPEIKFGRRRNDYGDEILQWDKVYDSVIQPYLSKLESMPTSQLVDFAEGIMTVIVPNLSEGDFFGDDWYGTDYSGDIQEIIDASEYAMMEAVAREDFSQEMAEELLKALKTAGKNNSADGYIDERWKDFEKLIKRRAKDGALKSTIFDSLATMGDTGQWIIRKIQYLESIGNYSKAEKTLNENLDIEDIKDFKYDRLLAAEKWDEAFAFLEFCDKQEKENDCHFVEQCKWTKKKLELATKLGNKDLQIFLLKDLFANDYHRRKYYDILKQLIDKSEWLSVYPALLKTADQTVSAIGEFLVEEGETDWLHSLIRRENEKSPISYHQMIEYYPHLVPKYESDMRQRIKGAFLRNARQRFAPFEKCKNEWYESFCSSLRDFRRLGATEEVDDLVATFLVEFRTRRNLIHELKSM